MSKAKVVGLHVALYLGLMMCVASSAQGQTVRLEGQVVCCAECWAKADRTKVEFGTAEDLVKAKSCVEGGDPTLLAVRTGDNFKLYRLEQGKFHLSGKNWLAYIGARVAVTGTVQNRNDTEVLRVDALEILATSQAERDAARVIGSELDLTLKDLFGTRQSLSAFKGRIVVLNFWATYCVPCRKEMPDLSTIQNQYAAFGVQVIGASTDEVEDRAKVLQFVKETRINFPIWMGATAADMMRFGLGLALPGTAIIDRDGRVVKVISGIIHQAELRKQIDAMLASVEKSATRQGKQERERIAKRKQAEVSSVPS